jgi:hypothetical protein
LDRGGCGSAHHPRTLTGGGGQTRHDQDPGHPQGQNPQGPGQGVVQGVMVHRMLRHRERRHRMGMSGNRHPKDGPAPTPH